MTQKLLLIKRKNRICTLTLNRPEKKNSLSLDLVELLGSTLKDLAGDAGVRVVILRGAGDKAFCSGFDSGERIQMLGLVDYLVPRADLHKFTTEMALEIAENAPLALKGIKRVIHLLMQANQLDKKSAKEAETIFRTALSSEDMQEGQAAFLEKRKPHFKGK